MVTIEFDGKVADVLGDLISLGRIDERGVVEMTTVFKDGLG